MRMFAERELLLPRCAALLVRRLLHCGHQRLCRLHKHSINGLRIVCGVVRAIRLCFRCGLSAMGMALMAPKDKQENLPGEQAVL